MPNLQDILRPSPQDDQVERIAVFADERTIENFDRQFEPVFDEDGADWQDFLPPEADLNFWWSIIELEFGLMLLAGWHPFAVGYVQCQKPWSEPQDQWCFEYRTFEKAES